MRSRAKESLRLQPLKNRAFPSGEQPGKACP